MFRSKSRSQIALIQCFDRSEILDREVRPISVRIRAFTFRSILTCRSQIDLIHKNDMLPQVIHTELFLATPSRMAKISVKPMATHKLSNTFVRGDLTCFQKLTCIRMVSSTPSKDIEQPMVEISSRVLRSVAVS